ncbi:MAG: M20/M25/M40 family metallo-hydrolase [Ignavibacteriales bacterium]|nr:MAG: M20/M25/M40 family metallo-hydrolase [Ignavibacteriales bacterium]
MKINYRIFRAVKKTSFHSFTLITIFIFTGCSSSVQEQLSPEYIISTGNLKANLEFLASDELEGREAATKSEELAALFIASELKKYGVKPFFKNYLQEYELFSKSADPESNVKLLSKNGETKTLNYFNDFIADRRSSVTTGGKYKIIFAGFGITAQEYDYDDYADLDIKGKIVVIADDEPYSKDTSYFAGENKSKYSRDSYKISLAVSSGAAGIIQIPSDYYLSNWDRVTLFSKGESVSITGKEQKKFLKLLFNESSLEELLKNEKYSYAEIKNLLYDKKPLPVFEINKEIEINVILNLGVKKSFNIVGIIEGNDSLKNHEYLAIGAHYDHLGVRDGEVYNGADDNGSGTVALLEVARAFAKTNLNERSVLFVFHGAEEKGLIGSEYFTDTFEDIKDITAHINMDMVGREHIDTICSVGSGNISPFFKEVIEQVNRETVNFVFNYKFDDPSDRLRIYYRSDHYNYAKHNIPIVFFYDFMKEDYHKGSDEVDKINFEKIKKTAVLVYSIALRTANLDEDLIKEKDKELQTAK